MSPNAQISDAPIVDAPLISDLIAHPGLLEWWAISLLVALLFSSIVRRQPWIRGLLLMFSAVWFLLTTCYVISFVVSELPRDIKFIDELGWFYFVQLELAAYLPWTAIRRFGKRSHEHHHSSAAALPRGI